MAQYKKFEIEATIKTQAFYEADRKIFTPQVHTETITVEGKSKKAIEAEQASLLMAAGVAIVDTVAHDPYTGIRLKNTVSIKVRIAGSVSAAGVDAEHGAAAIAYGKKLARKNRKARQKAKKQASRAAEPAPVAA